MPKIINSVVINALIEFVLRYMLGGSRGARWSVKNQTADYMDGGQITMATPTFYKSFQTRLPRNGENSL